MYVEDFRIRPKVSQASSSMYRLDVKNENLIGHERVSCIVLVMRMQSDLKGLSRYILTPFTGCYRKESEIIARIGNPCSLV
jgi:hypothetical protein